MVNIRDVTLRDGFQGLAYTLPTSLKVEIAQRTTDAGIVYQEIGSFISDKSPMYSRVSIDAADVLRQLKPKGGTIYCALAPTDKYMKMATNAGFKRVAFFISANEDHQKLNYGGKLQESKVASGMGRDKALFGLKTIREVLPDNVDLDAYIATAFGYKSLLDVTDFDFLYAAQGLLDEGRKLPAIVSLGDTFSVADYPIIKKRISQLRSISQHSQVSLHLHRSDEKIWKDQLAQAIDNENVDWIDSSMCGIGGCPTDAHESNIPTPELAEFLAKNWHGGWDIDELYRIEETLRNCLQ